MTSVGHFSLTSQTDDNPSVSTFFMSLVGEKPGFTVQDFEKLWQDREMAERHPRFHFTVSKDRPGHFESETVNDHVSETYFPQVYRKDIQSRIEALQLDPVDVHEKTWEVMIAPSGPLGVSGAINRAALQLEDDNGSDVDHNMVESLVFFRGHHALGDGVSLFTAIMDLCDEAEEFRDLIKVELKKRFGRKSNHSISTKLTRALKRMLQFWLGCLKSLWYQTKLYIGTLIESNPFQMLQKWALMIEEFEESTQSKRTISFSMAAPVDEVKWVARTLLGKSATVNDVFVSCVSAAIVRQLEEHRRHYAVLDGIADGMGVGDKKARKNRQQHLLKQMKHMNIVMPVHLYGGIMLPGQSMGNRIGAMVARVPGEAAKNSVDRLSQVHDTLYELKQTPTPLLSYLLVRLISSTSGYLLPDRWTQYLFSKANANATAVVSNVRGPPHPIHVQGRMVSSIHGFVPLPPGIPIGLVVSSYAGSVKLSLSAEFWAVPNGDQFLIWVLEEYQSLLRQALLKDKEKTLTSRGS